MEEESGWPKPFSKLHLYRIKTELRKVKIKRGALRLVRREFQVKK